MSGIAMEWKRFAGEARDLFERFCDFFSGNRVLRWFTVIIIAIVYGSRLIYGDYFIDGEVMMTNPSGMLYSWYGLGRFGLVITKKLFSLTRLVPYLAAVLLVIGLWCLSIFFCFCLNYWGGRAEKVRPGNFLFVLFFLSAPCYAEQFSFIFQAFEICFAMILCVIAVFTAGLVIYEKKSIIWLVPSYICLVWSLGSYQAFNAFYIALVAISFVGTWLGSDNRCGFLAGVAQAVWYIFGFISSLIVGYLLNLRAGADTAYINSMFLWQTGNLSQCLENIKIDFIRMYENGWPLFFRKGMLLFSILFIIGVLLFSIRVIRKEQRKLKDIAGLIIAVCVIPVSPILISIVTGMNQPIRAQFVFPLVYAFLIAAVFEGIVSVFWEYNFDHMRTVLKPSGKVLCVLVFVIGLYGGWRQCVDISQLWETAHESFDQDVRLAQSIYDGILEVVSEEGSDDWRAAFLGSRDNVFYGPAVMGDAIGKSFFSWDAGSDFGVSDRAVDFMNSLGFTLTKPDIFDYRKAVEAGADKPSWPDKGSIFKVEDGLLCVKLSD